MNIKSKIPNSITALNLLAGASSIILSFKAEFDYALLCILLAAIFDFFDGFSARLLKAYSDIGKQLDSLSDVISFGLAPSLLLYNYMLINVCDKDWTLPAFFTLFYAVQAAFRLAKFNVDDRQTHTFIGLPTPAAAGFLGALIFAALHNPALALSLKNPSIIPITAMLVAELTVSEIPMFSLKLTSFKWNDNKGIFSFAIHLILVIILLLLIGTHWSISVLYIFTSYICWNLIIHLFNQMRKRKMLKTK